MPKKKEKSQTQVNVKAGPIKREAKVQKNYSIDSANKESATSNETLNKVQLPPALEAQIIDLIQESHKHQVNVGSASLKLSAKKITDMYNALSDSGFKHQQIEQALNNVIFWGGDVVDALDWLCLNLANDQLPEQFSQSLAKEEESKKRPSFLEFTDLTNKPLDTSRPCAENIATETVKKATSAAVDKDDVKDYILRYAEDYDSDPNSSSEENETEKDPNDAYKKAFMDCFEAKQSAVLAKQSGDKGAQKTFSKAIRQHTLIMQEAEAHPGFSQATKVEMEAQEMLRLAENVKIKDNEEVTFLKEKPTKAKVNEEEELGFSFFEEQEAAESPAGEKEEKKSKKSQLDIRCFEYTRQQWTGKSPKQFLIDWVRKHLPGSPPPSYRKVAAGGNLWKSVCTVKRKKDPDVSLTPEIVTENLKEAEHLASMLVLYHLCKGQKLHNLMPPPYREVWLDWQEAESRATKAAQDKDNKPRDQLVSKILKKVKSNKTSPNNDSNTSVSQVDVEEDDEDDDWENLASDSDDDLKIPSKDSASLKKNEMKNFSVKQCRNTFADRTMTPNYANLLMKRKDLPIHCHKEAILDTLAKQRVLIVAGETGSGKSTQVPQFLLEAFLTNENSPDVNIVCTEPRRISATSLARRVSEEMGEAGGPGKHGNFVGYQIRFESRRSATTRLTYCTTGVLLRKLQQDAMLSELTHVVVDEVHERSIDSDFLLILLRQILQKRSDFYVILMSATADTHKFSKYFQHCPVYQVPGRTFPVEVLHLEDAIERSGYLLEEDSRYSVRYDNLVEEEHSQVTISGKQGDSHKMNLSYTKDDLKTMDNSGLDTSRFSLRTRNIITRMNPNRINLDLILELLTYLEKDDEYRHIDGAVLIFLPGLAQIQELYEMLLSDLQFSDEKRYKLIALHSVLSSENQSAAFEIPPLGVRKIVIATNIAETGITIPDVVFVIDSGKEKENRYMENSQMSALVETYISKASARQRQGRAGRVREGICFRLYTNDRFESLKIQSIPEMLRVPLEELCLHILKCELGSPSEFLSQALDPPASTSVSRAMSILREVGAYNHMTGRLTPLGHHLAVLPVDVRVGKMLVFGAILGCLHSVSIIAAAMTDKSPFAVPMGKRGEADEAKHSLATGKSDNLTLLKAFNGWKASQKKGKREEIKYCDQYFLKRSSLVDIENVSKDLRRLMESIGFTEHFDNATHSPTLTVKDQALIKAVLAAGLYPRVAKAIHKPKVDEAANPQKQICYTLTLQGPASIHPGSINRSLVSNGYVVFHEKIRSTQIYLRDTTLIGAYPLLLFGGDIQVQHHTQTLTMDDFVKYKAFARTAVIFKELRILINDLLQRKISDPALKVSNQDLVKTLTELIMSEK